MTIDRDIVRMQYVIRIDRDEIRRAFTSQDEYNALIVKISKQIYKEGKGRFI